MKPDTILVLDFGGQYCHLIGRRIRERKVYSEIVPNDLTLDEARAYRERLNVRGLILSGGPSSVYEVGAPRCDGGILTWGLPVLGLCYGHQLLAQIAGGEVRPGERSEYGISYASIDRPVGVLKGLGPREKVWMSHGDTVRALPEGYEVLAHTESCPVAAFRHRMKPIYGLQWHPEVVHTENGGRMLENFIFQVCSCEPNWRMEDFVQKAVEELKHAIGEKKAIIALSGGVDSSTATALASKALGRKLTAVMVDHGFMREGETEAVKNTFARMELSFILVDAKERFLRRLSGITDPEAKRKVIGEEFIRVFEEAARSVGAEYLIQGTIYPDRVESGFRRYSDKIKTHHNVGGLPSRMEFKGVVEPLRELYKDEVRMVAQAVGLPEEIVKRQPFPGPGLAIRVIGEVTPEKLEIARRADSIVRAEVEAGGLEDRLWQYLAVVTNTMSTGVKGDARAYGYTVAVRAVESREAMTASFAKIPYRILERISTRITNEIPEVTRVVYDITHKPPATIEWE
ncbi:MAG: glutamine-hydrolyzing GMP synthase [Candidatus Bathyarchaeia archaeon]